MKKYLLIFCFLSFFVNALAQKHSLDSLVAKIPTLTEKNYRNHLNLIYQSFSEEEEDKILSIYEKIISTGQKSPIFAVRLYTNIQVARWLNYKGIKEGVDICLEAYWAAKSKNLLFETAEAAKSLAYAYNMAENNEKTLQYVLEAASLYQKLGIENEEIELYYQLALVQYRLKHYKLALDYFLRLESKQINSLRKQEQINYFNAIALCHKKLKNYPEAFLYFEKSLETAKKYQKNEWIGILQGNKGDVFFEQKQLDSARYYWKIDLDSSKKYKIWGNVVTTLSYYAKSYMAEQNFLRAYQLHQEALSYIKQPPKPEYEVLHDLYNDLAVVFEHLDSFQLAYEYKKRAHAMDDSLRNFLNKKETQQVQLDFWLKDKEKTLFFEQKNAQRKILAFQIGIALLLIGIVVLAYFLLKQRKLNSFIKIQKLQIEEKSEEIARQNEELLEKQEEILQQKEVITQKNNEQEQLIKRLKHNDEFLSEAIDKLIADEILIREKNKELEYHSKNLEQEVEIRTQEIVQKNKELVQNINQLEQFSYVLAHNVRAPVARLLGLIICLNMQDLSDPQNITILNFINQSAKELDNIIKDLNKVLEIKKGIDEIYEKVDLKKKIEKQRSVLFEAKAELQIDLQVRYVYAVKAYTHSILYNLISNAIKYKHPNKQLVLHIRTYQDDTYVYLEVEDNGIGIDLNKHQDKIFGIYKRFHTDIEGKGLGLHIVKLQVEAMGGKIEIESKVNEGTKFKMIFKKTSNIVW